MWRHATGGEWPFGLGARLLRRNPQGASGGGRHRGRPLPISGAASVTARPKL